MNLARRSLIQSWHHIYIHLDPGTRELLYIGSSSDDIRPIDFRARKPAHSERLHALLDRGWKRKQIVRYAATHLKYETARRLEKELIAHLRPPFNIIHNPNAVFAVTVGSAVA